MQRSRLTVPSRLANERNHSIMQHEARNPKDRPPSDLRLGLAVVTAAAMVARVLVDTVRLFR